MDNGCSIGPACIKAIEESKISIVIISQGYASSTWCLEELVHILECRKTRGHIAWPIFYDVSPSELGELKGSFKDALEEHKSRCSEADLEKWKNAIKEIAYMKGPRVPYHKDGHEAENVECIVNEILIKLSITELDVATHQVGDLDASAAEVISFLDIDSKDIRIVGNCGIVGIGKTSLAKHVYNKIFRYFDGCSFLENVNKKIHRLETTELQTILLNDVLRRENVKIRSVAGGKKLIQERLKRKSFLLVLDDIHSLYQMNEILGSFRWFPERSRVIVTTRTRNLLRSSDFLYKEYEMKELNSEDSLRLLSLHAFAMDQPLQNYCYIAKELVKHCRRNPGALVRVGCYLNGKQIDVWNRILNDDVCNGISDDSEVVNSLEDYLGKILHKETHDCSIGVCYGRRGISLAGQEVTDLCKQHNICRMRLYEPNREILVTLRHTDIEVMLDVPNDYLRRIASSQEEANAWVRNKVKFYQNVSVRYIAVGNQVVRGSNTAAQFLLPAMENIQNALSSAGLNNIKVSTAVDTGILEKSYPPSKGRFREESWKVLEPILQFLTNKQSPLLVNVHPYFSYKREHSTLVLNMLCSQLQKQLLQTIIHHIDTTTFLTLLWMLFMLPWRRNDLILWRLLYQRAAGQRLEIWEHQLIMQVLMSTT